MFECVWRLYIVIKYSNSFVVKCRGRLSMINYKYFKLVLVISLLDEFIKNFNFWF